MGDYSHIGEGFRLLFRAAIIGLFLAICVIIYGGYKFWHRNDPTIIESKTKINPTYKLTIEDNKVDTIWVYKSN